MNFAGKPFQNLTPENKMLKIILVIFIVYQGQTEDFVMRGPRDRVYSGNMGMIAPIRTVNSALF